jgi:hypothetical protein
MTRDELKIMLNEGQNEELIQHGNRMPIELDCECPGLEKCGYDCTRCEDWEMCQAVDDRLEYENENEKEEEETAE